jgi:hypothetical protein
MINEDTNKNLDGFGGWGDLQPETDFFSQEVIEDKTDAKSVIEELKKDEKVEETKQKSVKEEENLFSETEIENEDFVDDKNKDDNPDVIAEKSQNIFILNKLKEKGFIDYELEEGEELTDELAEELIEEKFDESVDLKVQELLTELPDDKKQVVQFLIKGGNLDELIDTLTSDNISIKLDIDLEKEENQISTLKKLLKLEDKDEEEIETEIEYLKDSGKLKLMTEKKFNKYKAEQKNRQEELVKEQEEALENEKKVIKQSKLKISTFLTSNEEVDGIKFSKDDKKQLPSYMNDKTIKLGNGTTITQMQKELFYDLPKNEKALIQLATLLKNRNEDGTFNFESIVKSSKTKVAQEVRSEIRRNNTSIPGNSTNKNNKSDKSLSDYFNN